MWRPERAADRLSDAQERELEALDRAFCDAPAAELGAEHSALAALVSAVRDDRPPLGPGFAEDLDARLAAGFPRRADRGSATRETGRPGGGPRFQTRHRLAGLGGVAALAVAVVVVAGQPGPKVRSGGTPELLRGPAAGAKQALPPGGGAAGGPGQAPVRSATQASGAVSARPGASRSSAPVPGASPSAPARASKDGRVVQRDAALALLAPRGYVQQVTDKVIAATDRLGGIVQSSNVAVDDQGGSQASLELRVPSAALDPTLAALSSLAHVSSRSQNALDITDATAGARSRLAESRAERGALLRQLAQATNPNQVASIDAQLAIVAGRIAQDHTQLQSLLQRGGLAQLSVTIAESRQAAGGGTGWGPGAALDHALTVLEAGLAILLIVLAGLLPAALLAAIAWWAWRPVRRRRREGALAGAG